MNLRVDFRSGIPIYLQIVEQVKHLIASGQLEPGDQLPTVRRVAQDLKVNFNTVARAYQQLDEEGVISTQQGRGTYVLEQPTPIEMKKVRREKLIALVDSFLAEGQRLGYSPEELAKAWEDRFARWERERSKAE